MARYLPLSGRSAQDINFENAVRNRDRRLAEWIPGSDSGGVLTDESWDPFYGGLDRARETANEEGRNFRVDTGGLGNGGGVARPSLARLGRPGDEDVARNWAVNTELNELTARERARPHVLRSLAANADILEEQARQGSAPREDQAAFNRATALSRIGAGVLPGQIRETGPGSYQSRGEGPTANQRDVLLENLPGHLQASVQEAQAKADLAQRGAALNEAKLAEETRKNKADEVLASTAVMSPEAVEQNAKLYLQTGTMPPLGMRDPGNRQKILNRAAELSAGGGGNIAGNKADYKADSGSLTKLQGQRDAIGAFEQTALKNLDVFLELAAKVPDSGSPAINLPLRHITEKMLGGDALAAYNAARRTVIPEFAKILANPGLSGQLSDSARHEVEEVLSGNATLKQTIAVANVLKRDTVNRRTSYDDEIAAVKARIGGKGGGAGGTVKLQAPDGSTTDVPADQVDHYLKLGAKRVDK